MTDASILSVDASGAIVESWISIVSPTPSNTVLVVNADEVHTRGSDALREIIAELPTTRRLKDGHRLYFLGNPTPYPLQGFGANGPTWLKLNLGRLPIIGPILDDIRKDDDFNGVVFTSETVYDWDDWAGTPELQRFVRLEPRKTATDSPEDATTSPQTFGAQCVQLMRSRRPRKVLVSGESFFPFFWTNSEYKWVDGSLVAEATDNNSCIIGYLSPSDQQPEIALHDMIGGSSPMAAVVTVGWHDCNWVSLNAEESAVAKSCLETGGYTCPFCNVHHPANLLKCRKNKTTVLGRSVFPTLEQYKGAGFILFRQRDAAIEFAFHSCPHLLLEDNRIALLRSGTSQVDVVIWSAESRRWQTGHDRWQQFTKVKGDVHAVVL